MNFLNSMAFTAITLATALVAIISWWKTRGDNLDTQDGYYLGCCSLTVGLSPVLADDQPFCGTARWQQRSGSPRWYEYHGLGGYLRSCTGYPWSR